MAITRDAVTNSGNTTFAHTVAADANLLIVWVTWTVGTSNFGASVTYAGVAMTECVAIAITDGSSFRHEVMGFYLVSPSTGANDVVITHSGGTPSYRIHSAQSFIGVNETNPIDTTATGADSALPLSVTIVPTCSDTFVIDAVKHNGSTFQPSTPGASQVELWDSLDAGGYRGTGSYKPISSAGSTTMSWNPGTDVYWAQAAIALNSQAVVSSTTSATKHTLLTMGIG